MCAHTHTRPQAHVLYTYRVTHEKKATARRKRWILVSPTFQFVCKRARASVTPMIKLVRNSAETACTRIGVCYFLENGVRMCVCVQQRSSSVSLNLCTYYSSYGSVFVRNVCSVDYKDNRKNARARVKLAN